MIFKINKELYCYQCVCKSEVLKMKFLNLKKLFFVVLLSSTILIGQAIPVFASENLSKTEIVVEKADSTEIKSQKKESSGTVQKKESNRETPSNIAYNFIFYLLSKVFSAIQPYPNR